MFFFTLQADDCCTGGPATLASQAGERAAEQAAVDSQRESRCLIHSRVAQYALLATVLRTVRVRYVVRCQKYAAFKPTATYWSKAAVKEHVDHVLRRETDLMGYI